MCSAGEELPYVIGGWRIPLYARGNCGEEFPCVLRGEDPLCAPWGKIPLFSLGEELQWEKNFPLCSMEKNSMCAHLWNTFVVGSVGGEESASMLSG